jgi:hypothetical protein
MNMSDELSLLRIKATLWIGNALSSSGDDSVETPNPESQRLNDRELLYSSWELPRQT